MQWRASCLAGELVISSTSSLATEGMDGVGADRIRLVEGLVLRDGTDETLEHLHPRSRGQLRQRVALWDDLGEQVEVAPTGGQHHVGRVVREERVRPC